MPKISIIIPVYNVEKYLPKCLDSVLNQTFQDYEMILVDDGSTDRSGEICEEYAARDSRIRVFHQENQGVSAARNHGLEAVRGEWIGFMDADDFIVEDMYQVLYENAVRFQTGISMCRHIEYYINSPVVPDANAEVKILSDQEAIKMVMEAKIVSVNPVDKLYRRDLFDEVRFPNLAVGEDAYIMLELIRRAGTVAYTPAQKYYYVHRAESLTTSSFKEHDLDAIKSWSRNYQFVCKYYPQLEPTAAVRCCWAYFYVLDKMMNTPGFQKKDLQKQVIQELKKRKKYILNYPNFTRNRKIAFCLLMIHPALYRMTVRKFIQQKRKLF